MRKQKRQKETKLRKNFLPTLFVIVVLWLLVSAVVYFVEPTNFGALPLFFLLAFLALLFTFSTLFAHSRRGFLAAFGTVLFLVLRYFGVGNVINLLLLSGLIVTVELYFFRN